jgi:hypothetical protein
VAVATGVSATDRTGELVATGDLDALVDHVGHLCTVGDWEGLWDLRRRCRSAHERGHQLWPIASLVEYRCALDGPAAWSARAVEEGAGTWTLGPLPEVAATTHRFADLAPSLSPGPPAAQLARECAGGGEDLTGPDAAPWRDLLGVDDGVPLCLQAWEPRYPAPTYHPSAAEFPAPPPLPPQAYRPLPSSRADRSSGRSPDDLQGQLVEDPVATAALRDLTAGWATGWDTGATARVVAVEGDAALAIAATCPTADRVAPLSCAQALERMVWAAASGGDTGRRRGLAAGRFDAWWTIVALAGADDDWPLPPDEVGEMASALRWFTFVDPHHPTGWHLRLAAEDPEEGIAWALAAHALDNDDTPPPTGG